MAEDNQSIVEIIIKAVDETKDGLTGSINSLSDLKDKLGELSVAAEASFAVIAAGLVAMGEHFISGAAQMEVMSQKVGVSVTDLSTFKEAMEAAGTSPDHLQQSLVKLNVAIENAAKGNKTAQMAFQELGVEFQNADGTARSTSDVFRDIAERFADMQDGAAKTAIATQLFGKAGADLIPVLDQGAAGLDEAAAKSKKQGDANDVSAKQALQFQLQLKELNKEFIGVVNTVTAEVLPTLIQFVQELKGTGNQTSAFATIMEDVGWTVKHLLTGFVAIKDFIVILATVLAGAIASLVNDCENILTVANKLIHLDFKGAEAAWTSWGVQSKAIMKAVHDDLDKQVDDMMKQMDRMGNTQPAAQVAPPTTGNASGVSLQLVDPTELAKEQSEYDAALKSMEKDLQTSQESQYQVIEDSYNNRMKVIEAYYDGQRKMVQNSMQDEITKDIKLKTLDIQQDADEEEAANAKGAKISALADKYNAELVAKSGKVLGSKIDQLNQEWTAFENTLKKELNGYAGLQDMLNAADKARTAAVAAEQKKQQDTFQSMMDKMKNEAVQAGPYKELLAEAQRYDAEVKKIQDDIAKGTVTGVQGEQLLTQAEQTHYAMEQKIEVSLKNQLTLEQYDTSTAQGAMQQKLAMFQIEKQAALDLYNSQVQAIDKLAINAQQKDQLMAQAYQGYVNKCKELDRQGYEARIQLFQKYAQDTSSMLGDMATAAKAYGKSGFEVYKATASAQAMVNALSAATGAYSAMAAIPVVGPALGIAAAAAALAAGMANVASIESQQPSGAAHGGLDYVPSESTWLLQKGEAVLSPNQNADLRAFLASQNTGTGGGGMQHVVVNLDSKPIIDTVAQASRLGSLVIDSRNVRRGGY